MKRFVAPRRNQRSDDAWQIIYMDLMTIIMVFFVILWSINQKLDLGISSTIGEESVKMVNLPGDVLFSANKSKITTKGKKVFKLLFDDESGEVLNFDTGGLIKRLLVIHGHTDSDGKRDENFTLGYERAYSAYQEIKNYSEEVSTHVVICTHADNSPAQEVPVFQGKTTPAERATIRNAKSKNRRITIEDKMVNRFKEEKP